MAAVYKATALFLFFIFKIVLFSPRDDILYTFKLSHPRIFFSFLSNLYNTTYLQYIKNYPHLSLPLTISFYPSLSLFISPTFIAYYTKYCTTAHVLIYRYLPKNSISAQERQSRDKLGSYFFLARQCTKYINIFLKTFKICARVLPIYARIFHALDCYAIYVHVLDEVRRVLQVCFIGRVHNQLHY